MIPFPKHDAEQFFQTYVIRDFAFSKDEKKLVYSTNMNGKLNLWALDLPDNYPYRLTYNDQACGFIQIDAENRFILTSFDRDGDENYHIYALRPDGGQPVKLIEGESTDKFYFTQMSEDGERLYYVTSKDNSRYMNSRRYNLRTKEDELLHQGEETTTTLESVSSDESSLVISKTFSNTYILGYVKLGDELVCVTPSAEIEHNVKDFHYVDEKSLLFVTNYEDEFEYVASFDLITREFQVVCKVQNESVKAIKWHKDSRTLYFTTEKGVQDQFYTYAFDSGKITNVKLPVDVVDKFLVAESGNVYVLGRRATKASNIYIQTGDEWKALTRNNIVGLSEADLVEPEVVNYRSFDDLEIEALLYRAKSETANGYTVFWPHGGPQHAERKEFKAMFQFLIGSGYTIFAPNFRGSTCYGTSFVKMVEGDWGEGPRLDCIAGIEWLFEQGISARDKLFVVGGSYGGYMTLLLSGRHPEYFRASIDIVGVSNLFTFIESVPEHWKPLMTRWLGDPETDRDKLIKDSPITYINQMVKPMFIIQGANDPRVVKAESDQMVEALRKNGVEVEYLVIEDEGHGFSKKENEILVYRRMVEFLQRYH